jgi:DNA polymerase III subunit delta'
VLLLVAHQPSRLLPTIRSRCRVLKLGPLDAPAMARRARPGRRGRGRRGALAALSGGSVGEALRLLAGDGVALYGQIVALMGAMPGLPRSDLIRLADSAAGRGPMRAST